MVWREERGSKEMFKMYKRFLPLSFPKQERLMSGSVVVFGEL